MSTGDCRDRSAASISGLGAFTVGVIEGLAESTALIVKIFSGALSDYLGKRKGLAVFGYALGALTKPLFAVAPSAGVVLTARLLDRVGKGVRGAPRDALVADITPPHLRGAAFGLRQSLDTAGAFIGPLVASGLMLLWADDFRAVFWVAVIPGAMAVALLHLGLREPVHHEAERRTNPIRRENLKRLGAPYWWVVGVGAVFTLARFSEAFLVLRARQGGVPLARARRRPGLARLDDAPAAAPREWYVTGAARRRPRGSRLSRGLYVETSVLLRVVLEGDDTLRPLLLGDGRYTSALTFAEAARAIVRAQRDGRLDARGVREARKRIAQFGRSCGIVPVGEVVLERAGQECPVEPVRTLDAVHLATVLALNEAAIDLDVASCDGRVRASAEALGFTTLPTAN